MDPLVNQLIAICRRNHQGSHATQRKRFYELRSVAASLKENFGLQKWSNLKQKHIQALLEAWKDAPGGTRTIDQKLTHLRWMLQRIGKPNLLPRTNAEAGIASGPRYTRAGKAVPFGCFCDFSNNMEDPRIHAMMNLARFLGLRFEEASLFRPHRDWDCDRVWIKRGTKGGRPRYLYLHNREQRFALSLARSLTSGDRGLIPPEFATYEKWRQYVYRELRAIGMSREKGYTFHDLRRTYVVERMRNLLERGYGWDRAASLVTREVGHNRAEVLAWYMSDKDVETWETPVAG